MLFSYLEVEVCEETFLANFTGESLIALMDFYVFIEVSSLGEPVLAIWEITCIRPLICVNSQVIKEIVPFSKPLLTIFLVTFQNLYESL